MSVPGPARGAVSIEGLEFRRGRRQVLAIPSLTFTEGTTTAILGPNGAGKTTLLRLIAGIERPAAGAVHVSGQPATAPPRRVALAFQDPPFLRGSVRENLGLALRFAGMGPGERDRRVEHVAAACGIGHLLEREARTLSVGEARRAGLARALAPGAPVTLLDEPLAGLDGPARLQALHELPALLAEFATTAILVTHDRSEALRLAGRLVVLIGGRVAASGPAGEVLRHPPSPEAAAFLGYTVLRGEGASVAVAPGALRPGPGAHEFPFVVETVSDLGTHFEALGRIGATLASLPLDGSRPAPGDVITVSAVTGAVAVFPPENGANSH